MKKIVLISTVSAMALFATNGDNLIGLGSMSRGMGGVGIVTYFGAENALSNPALLTNSTGVEFDFGATYFAPDIKVNGKSSKADQNMIPEISISSKINDKLSYGLGMFGSAGMGVDFRDEPTLSKGRTNLLLMKVAPSIAYRVNPKFSIGFAPVIQYGALNISMENPPGKQIGTGVSDDFGLGYEFGATYDINPNIRLGFVYKSAIDMKYDKQISNASGGAIKDNLEQPEEYGLGYSYKNGAYEFAFDYKKIKWGSAKGYKDFGWKDQDVYALGAKYEAKGKWYSIGYNYAKTPLRELTGAMGGYNNFNYMFFPATAETHYTFGYGRKLSKNLSLGLNMVYAPKTTKNVTGYSTAVPPTFPIKTEHSETSYGVSFKYNF